MYLSRQTNAYKSRLKRTHFVKLFPFRYVWILRINQYCCLENPYNKIKFTQNLLINDDKGILMQIIYFNARYLFKAGYLGNFS